MYLAEKKIMEALQIILIALTTLFIISTVLEIKEAYRLQDDDDMF